MSNPYLVFLLNKASACVKYFCLNLQMLASVKSGKVSYKLAETADKAKTLVTVGGLSEASAEGIYCNIASM